MHSFSYTWEPLRHMLNTGLSDLGHRSWLEIGTNKEIMGFKPDWARYQRMEDDNVLRWLAVRDETGLLVGYANIVIFTHLHDYRVMSAYIQDIYLEPEARKGLTAFKEFMGIIIDNLIAMRVDIATIGERENDPRGGVGAVYRRLGFKSSERLWTINLKEKRKV